jgi:tRNA A-37 threonylcarbamoyl transferase component Bud32
MNYQDKHSDIRIEAFYNDITNIEKFENKIHSLYEKEFEEKLENILICKDNEFMSSLTAGVNIDLEDIYCTDVLGESLVVELLMKYEQIIHDSLYYIQYMALKNAWDDYVNKIHEFSLLSHYRKHCRYSKAYAKHSCDGSFIQVEEEGMTKYVICVECKKCYLHDAILMYCKKCDQKYYSVAIPHDQNINILPATWDKYHCNTMKCEKMRCIKCKDTFYYNLTENMLICLSCNYKVSPLEIVWNCAICKAEFSTDARPYNPMEYKFCKQAIRQSLLLKQRAKPYSVPCCDVPIFSTVFFHKGECNGELYEGKYDTKSIVVCSKCKTMNYYEKFLWTCPICLKRFKQRVEEHKKEYKINSPEKRVNANNDSVSPRRSINRSVTVKEEDNLQFLNGIKRLTIDNTSTPLQNEPISEKKDVKQRSLLDIIEERKKVNNNMKAKNDIIIGNQNYNGNSFLRKMECEFEANELVQMKEQPSALDEFNKLNNIYKDTCDRNDSKIEVTQTSFLEGNNVVNVIKRITKEVIIKDGKEIMIPIGEEMPASPQKPHKVLVRYQTLQEFNRSPELKLKPVTSSEQNENTQEKRNEKPFSKFYENPLDSPIKLINHVRMSLQNDSVIRLEEIKPKSDFVNVRPIRLEKFNINDYTVIRQVGEGSYGVIYLVEDRMRNKYAMKKIIAHNTTELHAFKSEFQLVNEARHPGIMKLYGMTSNKLDMTTYVLYILMELADNDWDFEIKQRLKERRPYTEDELRTLLKQLINCLAWLQKKNISHRDLKPQNILLFGNGVYKLADFGEAKEVKITKQLNTVRGTELYMAPALFEALRQNKDDISHNSFKSDVFSLGYCIIYAMNLCFNCLHDIREIRNMDEIARIVNKHFKNKYSQDIINPVLKMINTDENTRYDFIELENYIISLNL